MRKGNWAMKAMFFNGSTRKDWNTAKMLEAAAEGARDKESETANIFTMNCPKEMMERFGYPTLLESNAQTLAAVFCASETLYACNTCQFSDYSRYDMTLFTEEEKCAYRDAYFTDDLAAAREGGRR